MSKPDELSGEELHALMFCIDHMQMKHGFSSIVSRDGERVELQGLYEHVLALCEHGNGKA